MVFLLALLFFTVPFAELAFIIYVGSQLGVPETLLLLVAVSVVGAWLAKRQGLGVWRAVQRRLEAGQMPGKELTDGLLVLFAGALLLTPGFLTDIVAVLLLLPPVRAGIRRLVRKRFEHRIEVRTFRAASGTGRDAGPAGAVDAPSREADKGSEPSPPNS